MNAATGPRPDRARTRLLHVDPESGLLADHDVAALPRLLRPRDVVVVNDAATVPASLAGRTSGGLAVEVRLAGEDEDGTWTAVLFGAGDWRQRTEDRPAPPLVPAGETLAFGPALSARVASVSSLSPRLVALRFREEGAALWAGLYRLGRPVQYAYARGDLDLWDVQTAYASRPWAVEMPSAGRPLTAPVLASLRRAGVAVAWLTHAAGLSSTGDPALDAALPLPERFHIPDATVEAVARARGGGGRVVAVGTSVVRALEGSAEASGGAPAPGGGRTALRIAPGFHPAVVAGLLTGMHAPGESHFELLRALAPDALLHEALAHAEAAGYLGHEFGDEMLVLPL